MNKIKTTLVTSCVLYSDSNTNLYRYFDEVTPLFSFLVRMTIHHFKNNLNGEKETVYRTRLKEEYNLTNRFAKAVIIIAKSLFELSNASGEYLHSSYDVKIKKVNVKIRKTKAALNNPKTERNRIRNLKTKLFWLEMKKNRLTQLVSNGPKPIPTFGTKKLLKGENEKSNFLEKRDNQVVYVGDRYDYKGNQQFQLYYNKKYNNFTYKLRLENQYINDTKYIYGKFTIKDKLAKKEILKTLNNSKSNPLTFRIIKRKGILYLQIAYRIETEYQTRNSHGVLGVDFNKGFITISEINERGKLLNINRINYIHKGKAGITKNSMHHLVKDLSDLAIKSGKDIVIEDLKSLNMNKKREN